MATAEPSTNGAFGELRAQLRQWWNGLAPRERQAARIALALVAALLLWLVAIQPAWRTLRAAPAQIDALDAQLREMQRLAAESRELRGASPVRPEQATQALRAATTRLGDRAKLTVVGDRATLTLTGVTGPQLSAWLNEARSAARARPIEAQLTRGSRGYDGNVVVLLGGAS